nr:hypothetical protein [Tanacetum cinerariifolium]
MADENVPAPAPTRSDDQILPFDDTSTNIVHESPSLADVETGADSATSGVILRYYRLMKTKRSERLNSFPSSKDPTQSCSFQWAFVQQMEVFDHQILWEQEQEHSHQPFCQSGPKKGRKDKPHVITYCQFTKLIIFHLGRIHNIHLRSTSSFHLAEEDLRLGNLKFVHRGEKDEVFGMPIPNNLISNNIRNTSYNSAYFEMVAKHSRRIAAEKEGKKKPISAKQPKPKPATEESSKPTPAPKPKATRENPQSLLP